MSLNHSQPDLPAWPYWVSAAALVALALLASPLRAASPIDGRVAFTIKELSFDIAENGLRFVRHDSPAFEDGAPAHGAAFITQGYLYPAGTLGRSNGVNADGSPEFPDKVMGRWVCSGHFIGNGLRTETGPVVITTQTFVLGSRPGAPIIVTKGVELADVGEMVRRTITDGTGPFRAARGEQEQILEGFNQTMGVNLSVRLEMGAN